MAFFLRAYTTQWQAFIDAIRTKKASLADLVANESVYRPYWVNYVPPPALGNGGGGPPRGGGAVGTASGNSAHPDNNAAVAREIQKLRDQNQRLTQGMDRLNSANQRTAAANQNQDRTMWDRTPLDGRPPRHVKQRP